MQEASYEQLGFSPVLGPVDIGPSRQRGHPPACFRDAEGMESSLVISIFDHFLSFAMMALIFFMNRRDDMINLKEH